MSIGHNRRGFKAGRLVRNAAIVVAVVVVVLVLGALVLGSSSSYTPAPQHITVVRNGGPFDNHNIRQVIPPGAGFTWIGIGSTPHPYPDSTIQRYYTITSDPGRGDRSGVDVVQVPSQDGVKVGLEGTFYLTTAFDGSSAGTALVRAFDDQFGTRTFPVAGSGSQDHAWTGDAGWSAFLDGIVRPVIDNELRIAIGGFRCAELVASCALVQNSNADATTVAEAGKQNTQNIQQIETSINAGLVADLRSTLGHDYFGHIQFRLARVTLPDSIQKAVDDVQAARVEVARAEAKVQQAQKQNDANQLLSKTYDICAACAQIDAIKALPAGSNVYFGVQPIVTANGIVKTAK